MSSSVQELFALAGLLECVLDLKEIPRQHDRVFLEQHFVVLDGCRVLVLLHELLRDLEPQVGVIGPQCDHARQLGRRLVTLARSLIVIRERLVELD